MTIDTRRLRLTLRSREELLAMFEGMPEVSPEWLARVRAATEPDPFLFGYSVVCREGDLDVGSAGFKGPPDDNGMVEIAYGIEPEHQGRGYATEAAAALTQYALADDRIRTVRAHTKPENIASIRVLEKCGFRRIGEVVDPEDGLVWRFERLRTELL